MTYTQYVDRIDNLIKQYTNTTNPVTRCVLREIIEDLVTRKPTLEPK